MRIKAQFIYLILLIVLIPVICAVFIPSYYYLRSSDRLLTKGHQELQLIHEAILSKDDIPQIKETIRRFPAHVQVALFTKEFKLIDSTIPEVNESTNSGPLFFWDFLHNTRRDYYYQFTSIPASNEEILVLSRIPRDQSYRKRGENLITSTIIFLFAFVVLCLIMIIVVTRTIYHSIGIIQKQTENLANGKLNKKIETNPKNINEITAISASLEQMRLSLLEEQNKKNRFVMGISHDLRTPVAIIKGYTEAISDGLISEEEMGKTVDLIISKTSQLEEMIDTLISFMKLDTGDWRLSLKNESITSVIIDFVKEAEIMGSVFKRNIETSIHLEREITIPMDTQLVSRVFGNILTNAIRYSEENDTIRIESYEENEKLYLIISDTGFGIDKKDLDNIFDLFFRGTNSRREQGMGIGLSVVKSIIDTLNWKIDVQSEKGHGTCFTIIIPENEEHSRLS